MHGASGRQSLGSARHWQPVLRMYITPLITSRIATRRLPPPGLARRDQRLDMRPFRIGQVARITQFVAVVARAVVAVHMGHLKSKFTTPENHS